MYTAKVRGGTYPKATRMDASKGRTDAHRQLINMYIYIDGETDRSMNSYVDR